MCLARRPHGRNEAYDVVPAQAVIDVQAFLARLDEARPPQVLEMLGSVGNRELAQLRQGLDAALPLSQKIKKLQAVRASQSLADAGELLEELSLDVKG
jgi:hypothetical protein